MHTHLSAGEFTALTGLSAKALRLYGERGVLSPAAVDPQTNYRSYSPAQLRQGITVDLLRRAGVPVTELTRWADYPFVERRQELALRRAMEDFFLDVAEEISRSDPARLAAQSTPAEPLPWAGVSYGFPVPGEAQERIEVFGAQALVLPAVDAAFEEALTDLGLAPATHRWTAVPETTGPAAARQAAMVIARPCSTDLSAAGRRHVAERVQHQSGVEVGVVTGTLPRRLEITFPVDGLGERTLVQEAAQDHQQLLAFAHHCARGRLTMIGKSARQVVAGSSLSTPAAPPITVFDAQPNA